MSPRNLLICFDAYGTLFRPKLPIAQQYGDVARSLGLTGFTNEDVKASFEVAWKQETRANPNFGKASGMRPDQWWTKIILNTFRPLVGTDLKILDELAPRLLYRFGSEEAFTLDAGVMPILQQLRGTQPRADGSRVVVGVVTNSDHRVPGILTSLGLRVGPLRYGEDASRTSSTGEAHDVDFVVMSYDVGCEKPDTRMFRAAEELLMKLPAAEGTELSAWERIYVGDEYAKDVVGATGAGWKAVLVGREAAIKHEGVVSLEGEEPGSLLAVLEKAKAVGVASIAGLTKWLP